MLKLKEKNVENIVYTKHNWICILVDTTDKIADNHTFKIIARCHKRLDKYVALHCKKGKKIPFDITYSLQLFQRFKNRLNHMLKSDYTNIN